MRRVVVVTVRQFMAGLVVLGVVSGVLWFSQPLLADLGNYNLIVFFLVLLGACVFGGIPIAFAFGTATMAYLALATHAPLSIVVGRMDEGMSHMVLLAVPLFVLLGVDELSVSVPLIPAIKARVREQSYEACQPGQETTLLRWECRWTYRSGSAGGGDFLRR